MRRTLLKFLPACLTVALLTWGCAQTGGGQAAAPKPAAKVQQQTAQVYKGKIVGKSNKAKTITIKVGKGDKAKTVMLKFDAKTTGVEHAVKGHAAIIHYEKRGGDIYAVKIQPKLAKLPPGVTEISVAEVKALMDKQTDFVLIDARPAKRYAQAHLPGAISIPVPKLKKQGAKVLPKDKDRLLVFYCGGPT